MNKIYLNFLVCTFAISLSAKPFTETKTRNGTVEEKKYFKEKTDEIKKNIEKARDLKEEQLPALRKRLSKAETEKDSQLTVEIEKEISSVEDEIDSLQSKARIDLTELQTKERELGEVTEEIKRLTNEAAQEYDYGIKENIEDCIQQDIATKSLLKSKKLGLSQRSQLNDLVTKLSAQLAELLIYEHTKFKDPQEPSLAGWQQRRSEALKITPGAKNYDQKYQELLNLISYTESEIAQLLNIKREIFEKEFDVYSTAQLCTIELFSKFTGSNDIPPH